MTLLLAAVAVLLAGAVLAGLARSSASHWIGAGAAVLAAPLGLIPAAQVLSGHAPLAVHAAWQVPGGAWALELDPLSAFFLVPVLVLGAIAAVYGRAYLAGNDARAGTAWFATDLLLATMILVLLARNAVLFLVAWEVMSLAAWLLVAWEHEKAEARAAGWVYLVAAHVGVTFLVALFIGLRQASGGAASFEQLAPGAPASVLLALALVGFGAKAGLVPFHFWLPEAHAAAPSHVSALLSGVMVKLGIYGILRVLLVVGGPPMWLGPVLLGVGVTGAVLGISLALWQRDLKRALACSSVENVGLIAAALGVGTWAAARGDAATATLGLTAALLHTWNHGLMKGLLFLGAGSVLHGTGTKDLERLGGLMQRMPRTGMLFAVGAVAIAGLPPLNGFVGEWLLYLALVRAGGLQGGLAALLAVGILALVGGVAAFAFVRLVGIAFLGAPRSEAAAHAHETPGLFGPMALLAGACFALAVGPELALGAVRPVVAQLAGPTVPLDAPVRILGAANAAIWATGLLVAGLLTWRLRAQRVEAAGTWDCGYAAPSARMQYTASAFAENVSAKLLPRALAPVTLVAVPSRLFPPAGLLSQRYSEPLLRGALLPFLVGWADRVVALRRLQRGRAHVTIAWMAGALVLLLVWSTLRPWGQP